MFTHLISSDNILYIVKYNDYARLHYLKKFQKDYRGKQWDITEESIFQDLSRIKTDSSDLQRTQQVDELWHSDSYWIFKYDFRVAQTKHSTKSSGNRCIVFLYNTLNRIELLIIYGKGDLPKNSGEQYYIEQTLTREFSKYMTLVR